MLKMLLHLVLGLYVPQTAWLRHMMKRHSQLLGDDWKTDVLMDASTDVKYPKYFLRPLHGLEKGGACKYQALYQSPSMRYIMRMFQGNPEYREDAMHAELSAIDVDRDAYILDLGCGVGDSTAIVYNVFAPMNATIVGVDLSPYMIELAKRRTYATYIQGNAARLDMIADDSVDVITSFAMFHEMPRRYSMRVLSECHRVLKPGGHLFVWDQMITEESAKSQTCDAVPAIEPHLKSYAKLSILNWLTERQFAHTHHKHENFMQFWYAKK